jgi:hypothetical protein
MTNTKNIVLIAFGCCLFFTITASGQIAPDPAENEAVTMITQIYKEVSSDGSEAVDWGKVRASFMKDAIIILRTSREGSTQFTLEEFIQDFKDFYESSAVGESGFKEEVLRVNAQVYGDAAYIGVVYEATILDSERPPQKGIDFWLLTRKDKAWKVVAVTNEIIPPGKEIPEMFEPEDH